MNERATKQMPAVRRVLIFTYKQNEKLYIFISISSSHSIF